VESLKTVFVTGGSRGIGRSIVDLLSEEGYKVIAPTRAELDLSSRESISAYFEKNPKIECDVLINNAGINPIRELGDFSEHDWAHVIDTNLISAFQITKAIAPSMKRKGWGRIVNISSCYSLLGRKGRSAYSASKAGLNGLTRAVAVELAPFNILVNSVCPGFVATELTYKNNTPEQIQGLCGQVPLSRLAEPREIAAFVGFLCSEKNTYITGQSLSIDGGFTIV
jgi:3-oxoacyl-[acyl-carrier protein] reductase